MIKFHRYWNTTEITWKSHKSFILGWILPCSLGWCSPLRQPLHMLCATQWGKTRWSRTSHPAAFQLANLMKLSCFHSGSRPNDASNWKRKLEKWVWGSPGPRSSLHHAPYLIPHCWEGPGPVINCTSPNFCAGVNMTTWVSITLILIWYNNALDKERPNKVPV